PGEATFTLDASRLRTELPVGELTEFAAEGKFGKRGLERLELQGVLGEGRFRALAHWHFRDPGGDAGAHLVGEELLVYSDHTARLRASPNLWVERGSAG